MEEDLRSIIDLSSKGHIVAQKQLYYLLADDMFRLCKRYVKEIAEAEDILLKCFMKVFSNLPGFIWTNEAAFYGWVKKIMINECLMCLRKQKMFHSISEVEEQAFTADISTDECEDIMSMILQLPPGYRTVLNLFIVEGYSHKEIAAMLNISEGASKSQLSKARAGLKILLSTKGIIYDR